MGWVALMVAGFIMNCGASQLRVALSHEISNIDPQATSSVEAIKVQSALFETLVIVDSKTGEIQPFAAQSWSVSQDGLVYDFILRDDLRWSDGSPITAHDYVFTFKRLLQPGLAAPFSSLYFVIVGAEAFNASGSDDFDDVGVKAINDLQLRITLNLATPYFLTLLCRPCVGVIHQGSVLAAGELDSRLSAWAQTSDFITSGPYKLQSWEVNRAISLSPNPYHRSYRDLQAREIVFYPMESAYLQERAFLKDVVDVTSKLASERIAAYEESPYLVKDPELGTFYLVINHQRDEMRRLENRLALNATIQKDYVVKYLRKRGELPADAFSPPAWAQYKPAYKSTSIVSHQFTGQLTLIIASSAMNQVIAEALQAMWMENLGIQVNIEAQEAKSYFQRRSEGDFDLCLGSWIGDYFDPLTFLEIWRSDSPNNFASWHNTDFDGLLDHAATVIGVEDRYNVLRSAEQMLIDQQVIIPLFYLNRVYLRKPHVHYWPQTILNTVNYAQIVLH